MSSLQEVVVTPNPALAARNYSTFDEDDDDNDEDEDDDNGDDDDDNENGDDDDGSRACPYGNMRY